MRNERRRKKLLIQHTHKFVLSTTACLPAFCGNISGVNSWTLCECIYMFVCVCEKQNLFSLMAMTMHTLHNNENFATEISLKSQTNNLFVTIFLAKRSNWFNLIVFGILFYLWSRLPMQKWSTFICCKSIHIFIHFLIQLLVFFWPQNTFIFQQVDPFLNNFFNVYHTRPTSLFKLKTSLIFIINAST